MTAKILIADGEADLDFLRRLPDHDCRYDFHVARTGPEAIDRLHADPEFMVVVADLHLPVLDGLALLTRLPAINPLVVPLIAGVDADPQIMRAAMNQGAVDFLAKPLDLARIDRALRSALLRADTLRQAARSREQQAARERERTVAGGLQRSMLPGVGSAKDHWPEIDFYAALVPAPCVGGDLYDCFFLDADRLVLAIGDVSRTGMAAARFMTVTCTLLRAVAHRGGPPGECLAEINANLCRNQEDGAFASLFCGFLDIRTGQLAYGNAGHPAPLLLSPAEPSPRPLAAAGDPVLGVANGTTYETRHAKLRSGEALFLYTDGITDAADEAGQRFTWSRLEAVLGAGMADHPRKLIEDVFGAVRQFIGNAPLRDDLAALAVRHRGRAGK